MHRIFRNADFYKRDIFEDSRDVGDRESINAVSFAKCVSGNARSIDGLSHCNRRGDIAEHFSEDTLISVGGPVSDKTLRRFSFSLSLSFSLFLYTQCEEIRRIKSPENAGRGGRRGTRLSRKVRNSRASALQTLSFVVLSAPASSGVSFSFSPATPPAALSLSLHLPREGGRAPPYRLPQPPRGQPRFSTWRNRARACVYLHVHFIRDGRDL